MNTESKIILAIGMVTLILFGIMFYEMTKEFNNKCICEGPLCYRLEGEERFFCEDYPTK